MVVTCQNYVHKLLRAYLHADNNNVNYCTLMHLSVLCPTPSLGYRGDLTNLGVNASCIEARYIVKSALCSHPLIGVPPPIYMGFDLRVRARAPYDTCDY